jgi:predicted permease
MKFLRRIQYLFNRGRLDRELANDMEFHREMAARDGVESFGNSLKLREEAREAWGWTWIDRLSQDLRYAFRMMRRSPGFTASAVLMLAVGIGVNVAVFSFFNLVVVRTLPIREPQSLLRFHRSANQNYASDVPYASLAFYREHTQTMSAILGFDSTHVAVEGMEEPSKIYFVTANFFHDLGGRAAAGRLFDPTGDEDRTAAPVAVISQPYWQRAYGGDQGVIGKVVRLNGKPVTLIGVVENRFSGLVANSPDFWMPMIHQPYLVEGSELLISFSPDKDGVDMWGRLKPGFNAKHAEDELRMLTAELRKEHPNDIWEDERLISEPGGYVQNAGGRSRGNGPTPGLRERLYPVFGLAAALSFLILAVACSNLGSLLLARGVARQREMAMRTAVGAGTGRLIRQLLTESVMLAMTGAAAGFLLGSIVLQLLLPLTDAPAWLDVSPDWRVFAFTIGIGFAASMLFGLAPALQIARRRQVETQRTGTMWKVLISAQVAASCVLLIVAGLLVRAFDQATSGNPGFEYKQVIAVHPQLMNHGYNGTAARTYLDTLTSRLRGISGVESVSISATPPLGNRGTTAHIEENGKRTTVFINGVDPEYFATMKIPILRGRNLSFADPTAAVVSESFGAKQWPGEDPVGKSFDFSGAKLRVAGVAGNARALALSDPDSVELYQPVSSSSLPHVSVLVRTAGPVEGLVPAVASMARSIDPKVIPSVQMLKTAFAKKIEDTERSALSISILGVAALLLACLGIVGVVAYAVSQRTKEIGIRMAIGAKPSHVVSSVLAQFSRPVVAGLVLGIGGAAALSQLLRQSLYGISNLDPIAYVSAILIFALAATIAALIPARRALRIDPLIALRGD